MFSIVALFYLTIVQQYAFLIPLLSMIFFGVVGLCFAIISGKGMWRQSVMGKCNNRKVAGFTLLEMMIVVAIVLIVAGGSIPKLRNSFGKNYLLNDLLSVQTILRAASVECRATRQQITVEISESAETVRTYIDYDENEVFSAGDKLMAEFTANSAVDIAGSNGGDPLVFFFLKQGTINNVTGGTFRVGVKGAPTGDVSSWYKFTVVNGSVRIAVYKGYA